MGDTLVVGVNRDTLHGITPESIRFETTDEFTVRLDNHGRATHVHLALDGGLGRAASLPEANHFVETDGTVDVDVDLHSDLRPTKGRLKIVTGYGANTEYVNVIVGPESGSSNRTAATVATADANAGGGNVTTTSAPSRSTASSVASTGHGDSTTVDTGSSAVGDPKRRTGRSGTEKGIDGLVPDDVDAETAAVGGLMLLAIVLAAAALWITRDPVVLLGVLVVLATAGAGAVYVLTDR